MALLNYGFIVLKNGILHFSGCASTMDNRFEFYKISMIDHQSPLPDQPGYFDSYNCWYELDRQHKYVNKKMVGDIEFHFKKIQDQTYVIKFSYQGDDYVVLQGYDISLDYFFNPKKTIPIVKNFLKRYHKDPDSVIVRHNPE